MDYNAILYEVRDNVATITLNRPETLNAISNDTRRELPAALRRAEADDDVWVVVLTGAGRGFCSGADLKQRANRDPDAAVPFQLAPERDAYPVVMREISKPIIAAVNGAARGAGCNMVFAADFRIAAAHSSFAVNFVERGLMGESSAYFLNRLVGLHRATELSMLGEVFSAQQAEEWGLLNAVVDGEELMRAAYDLAAKLCTRAPLALRLTKEALNRSHLIDPEQYMALQNQMNDSLRHTSDSTEGVRAFIEKRPPEFRGR